MKEKKKDFEKLVLSKDKIDKTLARIIRSKNKEDSSK